MAYQRGRATGHTHSIFAVSKPIILTFYSLNVLVFSPAMTTDDEMESDCEDQEPVYDETAVDDQGTSKYN